MLLYVKVIVFFKTGLNSFPGLNYFPYTALLSSVDSLLSTAYCCCQVIGTTCSMVRAMIGAFEQEEIKDDTLLGSLETKRDRETQRQRVRETESQRDREREREREKESNRLCINNTYTDKQYLYMPGQSPN